MYIIGKVSGEIKFEIPNHRPLMEARKMKRLFFVSTIFLLFNSSQAQIKAQDGKIYKTVKIGNQTWTAENLNVSTYANGDTIPQVQDPKIWSGLKTGAWCYYQGKTESGSRYGKLYNWYAVNDPRGLAPEGWHIPTDEDWNQLASFLGGRIGSSEKIKAIEGWAGGGNGTNETGFTALPGGTRSVELFSFAGNYGYWWSSTEYDSYSSWNRFLGYNNGDIGRSTGWKQFGNSIRCVKGEPTKARSKPTQETTEIKTPPSLQKHDTVKIEKPVEKNILTGNMVKIGDQVWMSENLDVTKFQNGDVIPQAVTDSAWARAGRLKQPAWCFYDNDSSNRKNYGRLYNWYAIIDKRGLAPAGWHIPTESDWNKLKNEIGDLDYAGGKLKSPDGWKEHGDGSNGSGFSALPGGFRAVDGPFYNVTIAGYWWSSTESFPTTAWHYKMTYYDDVFNSDSSGEKEKGLSVRCIRN